MDEESGGQGDGEQVPPGLTRRRFLGLLGAGVAGGAAVVAFGEAAKEVLAPQGPVLRTRTLAERREVQPDAVFSVRTARPLVALSFDDGPDPSYTPEVLRILGRYGARATFFMIGANALAYPALVAAVRQAGHSIGNHTQHHPQLELLPAAQVDREIDLAAESLVAVGAPRPSLFRPPHGYTDVTVASESRADRYRTVYWTQCLEHFINRDGIAPGVERMLSEVRRGAVLLAHDGGSVAGSSFKPYDRTPTVEALPRLLEGLAERRLGVVDVPTLLRSAGRPLSPLAEVT